MDKDRLAGDLEAGKSIESIAREAGRHPSTVAYWVRKLGLESAHAERHRARGGIPRATLVALVDRDLTVREIAAETDRSPTTVRYWLTQHGLRTSPEARRRGADSQPTRGSCPKHGEVTMARTRDGLVCARCRADGVSEWRRRAKRILVAEAGGRCAVCGYDRCIGALQFHHLDPQQKRFGLGSRGLAQGIERLRSEARKCVLLCANCHVEVEAGVATIPAEPRAAFPGSALVDPG